MCMRWGCNGTWIRFEMFREPSPCGIRFSMWWDKWNHVHSMWSHIIYVHVFKTGDVVELKWGGHEWVEVRLYPRGYPIWNICVAHVDPWVWVSLQDWVILTGLRQSRLNDSVLMESCGFITTCPPELLSQMFFWYGMHMKKRKEHCIANCIILSLSDLCDWWCGCHECLRLLCYVWMVSSLVMIFCDVKLL